MSQHDDYQSITLANLGGGIASEAFEHALESILTNIQDPNTKAAAKRSIEIKIDILPSEDRKSVTYMVSSKTKLAAKNPAMGLAYIARNGKKADLVQSNMLEQPLPFMQDGELVGEGEEA